MITISNFSSKKSDKPYVFSDLDLNFKEKKVSDNNRNNNIVAGNDLVILTDKESIKTNIKNILFQKRHLTPLMNVNLQKHLGQIVSEMRAISIGNDIEKAINLYEPRVTLEKVFVIPNFDQNMYFIRMQLQLVNLDQARLILDAFFENTGNFDFVNI